MIKESNILNEYQCEDLFDESEAGSWNKMMDLSKVFKEKFTELIAENQQDCVLFKLASLIEGLQIYREDYVKVGRLLIYVDLIEKHIAK